MAPPREKWAAQASMLAARLDKNQRRLQPWRRKLGISCYRLFDRDIPELPLAIDVYEDYWCVFAFAPKMGALDPQHPAWIQFLVEQAATHAKQDPQKIVIKERWRRRADEQYERLDARDEKIVVAEQGHRFYVNLYDYLDTGLFLDHRILRARVQNESADKRVLNLFAYTGAFSVYAGKGGAQSVCTVDLSSKYLEWAQANWHLNGLPSVGSHDISQKPAARWITADVLVFIREAIQRREQYDLIVVDPPTMSRSKKMESDFDIQRDHVNLLSQIDQLLAPSGRAYFSTNCLGFSCDAASLRKYHIEIQDLGHSTISPDFMVGDWQTRPIHRSFAWTKLV